MTTLTAQELEEKRVWLTRWIPQDKPHSVALGVDHVAVFAKNLEATAAFYTEVMGMPVVNITANRDVPESTHMNVDIGNGMQLSFFDFPHVPRLHRRAPEGAGGIMHLALAIPPERLPELKERLTRCRVRYQEIGGSVYFKDPNGLGVELLPSG